MKNQFKLECNHEFDFVALAINSHSKGYKLCWELNKHLGLNFEMKEPHTISKNLVFTIYSARNDDGVKFNLISNKSKKGALIASQKGVNFFLTISYQDWIIEKKNILNKLRKINDILLVFELDLEKTKNSDRLIIYDKKN